MFGMETLDIVVGLSAIYLIFAIACTALVEAISALIGLRAKMLEAGLDEMLAGELGTEKFVAKFYAHPLVQSLSKGANGRPSYIPPPIVSQVICDLIGATRAVPLQLFHVPPAADEREKVAPSTSGRVETLLRNLNEMADNDLTQFRKQLETQFDATMDRVNGWFKRRTQLVTLVIAGTLVIGTNLDTLALLQALGSNPQTRAQLMTIANRLAAAEAPAPQAGTANVDAAASALQNARRVAIDAQLPIGWDLAADARTWARQSPWSYWGNKLAGLLISIFAISLGAPFWFDLMQRFIRAAGVSPRAEKK